MDQRYSNTAIALHWLLAAGILFQIGLGWYLGEVPRGTPARTVWVNFHKSVGLTLGALILVRLIWRLAHRPPPLPESMPAWERVAARANHALLYVCMVTMPVAGFAASNFSKFGVKYFGLVQIPPLGIDDQQIYAVFQGIHVGTSYLFVALIGLHVAAALKHLLIDRDGIVRRMWPARGRAPPEAAAVVR
jgi:cytochrome b561